MEPARQHPAPPSHVRGLSALRRWFGLTYEELAEKTGVNERSIRRWERGENSPRRKQRDLVEHWFAANGVSPDQVWDTPETFMTNDITDLNQVRAARGLPITTTPATPAAPEETPVEIMSREYLEPEELEHFGLEDDPFDDLDEPEDIYLSPALVRAEKAIINAIRRRQIVIITAEPGAGKSTLLRRIYGRVGTEKKVRLLAPASLNRERVTHAALATAILRDLIGRDTSSMAQETRSELLRTTLEDQDRQGMFPALLLDEAHHLNPKALLAIKQLWDSHTLFRQLAVILVGQPTLRARLKADPTVRELTGRARMLELPPLGQHVGDYLRWRFARVGADADKVFAPDAYEALGLRGEYPLWVNNLAVASLQYAADIGDEVVSAVHVGRV